MGCARENCTGRKDLHAILNATTICRNVWARLRDTYALISFDSCLICVPLSHIILYDARLKGRRKGDKDCCSTTTDPQSPEPYTSWQSNLPRSSKRTPGYEMKKKKEARDNCYGQLCSFRGVPSFPYLSALSSISQTLQVTRQDVEMRGYTQGRVQGAVYYTPTRIPTWMEYLRPLSGDSNCAILFFIKARDKFVIKGWLLINECWNGTMFSPSSFYRINMRRLVIVPPTKVGGTIEKRTASALRDKCENLVLYLQSLYHFVIST